MAETVTFEEFVAVRRTDGGPSGFARQLVAGEPVAVPDHLDMTAIRMAGWRIYGPRRVRTRTINGHPYICLMPDES